jgi:hypothetical protein
MVSLGSAFWLGVLKKLLGFRSQIAETLEQQGAQRERDQREKRQ